MLAFAIDVLFAALNPVKRPRKVRITLTEHKIKARALIGKQGMECGHDGGSEFQIEHMATLAIARKLSRGVEAGDSCLLREHRPLVHLDGRQMRELISLTALDTRERLPAGLPDDLERDFDLCERSLNVLFVLVHVTLQIKRKK